MTVWPDADAAGLEYGRQVAKLTTAAGALSVAIVSPPHGCKIGWDAADALADAWDEPRTMGVRTPRSRPRWKCRNRQVRRRPKRHFRGRRSGGRRRTPQRER